MPQYIYLPNGHLAGCLLDNGATIQAISVDGTYLGYYIRSCNQTFDHHGHLVQLNGQEALGYLIINHAIEHNL